MDTTHLVIAIDGPAGAGKSTVSKLLSKKLGIRYLDTGAMYRAIGLRALREGISTSDESGLVGLVESSEISFGEGDPQPVFINGEDVTNLIRTPEVAQAASELSTHGQVRVAMVKRQQAMVAKGGVVLEGRDATTTIAPNATLKVYLTASLEERAKRRHLESKTKGMALDYISVRRDIEERDHRDITREESPLTVAEDAHLVESAGLDPNGVADAIIALLG